MPSLQAPLRHTWLKAAVDAAPVVAGKSTARAIRQWARATSVIADRTPTKFGRALLADDGWDPYLEDPASLWLLHWKLASTPARTVAHWLFNIYPTPEFTIDTILQSLAGEPDWPSSPERELDACLRSYVSTHHPARASIEDRLDRPLTRLGLIRPGELAGTYVLTREPRSSLPPPVFGYALQEFLQRRNSATVALDELMFLGGAPGRVFGLDEDGLLRLIAAMGLDATAGHVRLPPDFDPMRQLDSMFAARSHRRAA